MGHAGGRSRRCEGLCSDDANGLRSGVALTSFAPSPAAAHAETPAAGGQLLRTHADGARAVNKVDRQALQRSLKLARAEPEYRDQLECKVEAEGWESAARFASYSLQIDNLGLRPWMDPPCFAEVRPDPE